MKGLRVLALPKEMMGMVQQAMRRIPQLGVPSPGGRRPGRSSSGHRDPPHPSRVPPTPL